MFSGRRWRGSCARSGAWRPARGRVRRQSWRKRVAAWQAVRRRAPAPDDAVAVEDKHCQVEAASGYADRGYRFPSEIISHAVWLYYRFGLSFRDVEDLLAERGITVTYEAIRLWCRTFGLNYARRLRRRRGRQGDTWYLDELFVKIQGQQQYLWRAVDEDGDVLDILVQSRRNRRAATRFFRKLLKRQGREPRRLITDKLRSYSAAPPYRDAVRDPQYPAVRKQSRGSLASINPPAGAADAQVQVGRPSATVRLGARRRPESLPGRTSPAPGSSPPSLEGPFVPSVG